MISAALALAPLARIHAQPAAKRKAARPPSRAIQDVTGCWRMAWEERSLFV